MPRVPLCVCGTCARCKRRVYAHARYQKMSLEQRREWVARRDREKVRAADRARYVRDRAKRLAAQAAYRQTETGRMAMNQAGAAWAQRNPDKRRAQIAVGNAVRDGRLEKGPCEREDEGGCSARIEAHHDDYARPLDVRWLCRRHHIAEHASVVT